LQCDHGGFIGLAPISGIELLSLILPLVAGRMPPGASADCRLRVSKLQPRQPLLRKYVPRRVKQFGMIERTDMEIRHSGQAGRFASER
jgi:hypothetical protein